MKTPQLVDVGQIERALGPLDKWYHNCHAASLHLVRSGVLPKEARVARGSCPGVAGQHSWVVLGDPYDPEVLVVDPTLWSYEPIFEDKKMLSSNHPTIRNRKRVWMGRASEKPHTPQGAGSIWDFGSPPRPQGPIIKLNKKLSPVAMDFLKICSPIGLDYGGWMVLANAPVFGWPAAEILEAMYETPELKALVPFDVIGMLTEKNPGKLYR